MAQAVIDQDELRKPPLVISARDLRDDYLFGIALADKDGNEMPDRTVEKHIRRAQERIANQVKIDLFPKRYTSITDEADEVALADVVEDRYDLDQLTWNGNWGFMALRHRPIIEVHRWKMMYGDVARIWEFPSDWFQVKRFGTIQLTPTAGTLGQMGALRSSNWFLPMLAHGSMSKPLPGIHRLSYTAGFTEIPDDVIDVVAKEACVNVLNVVGDSILAGVASMSLSIDGMSESVNTTQSAENALYSARIRMYRPEIKDAIKALREHYHGPMLTVA